MANSEQSAFPHIYRPKWKVHLINISAFILMTLFAVSYFAMAILPYFYLMYDNSTPDFMMSASGIILLPIVLVSLITYLVLAVILIAGMFAMLHVDKEGLEYQSWPQLHIRCKWSDVHLIGKHLWLTDVLYLNQYVLIGTSISLKKPFSAFRMDRMSIPLSKFNGWKNGALADDLRNYAPQLFDAQSIAEAKQNINENHTSNERFLCAISHASFYLGMVGIILPIILWFEQKGKSNYTRYQAVQAIIWQIVVHVFMAIFLIVIAVVLSVIVVVGTLYQDVVGMQMITIIGMIVMAFVTLIFLCLLLVSLLYPTIAIIRTAQGKDFQFAWFGKLAKKE